MKNKKGELSSFMLMILNTIIFILASPIIAAMLNHVTPNLSAPAAFFANISMWFILLMFLSAILKSVNGIGGAIRK